MVNNYPIMEKLLSSPEQLSEYALHPDWRVRYTAAVAMGEDGSVKWLPHLKQILEFESTRDLYSQPAVLGFENSYDDTRMAEQLVSIKEIFDQDYPEDIREGWRCRGRVRQACVFALRDIGSVSDELLDMLHSFLEPGEDHAVQAASAMALAEVGDKRSIPYLEQALEIDEWCLQTEAAKALRRLKNK